jgi:6-phosphogluconolactonase
MNHSSDRRELDQVQAYPDVAGLARAAAEYFVTLSEIAIAARGRFTVALAGGSTPRAMYTLLTSDEFATRVDWSAVHVFWGDERCVLPDHPDSNYRMARTALLDHVPLPAGNVHRMFGELEPVQAATEYQEVLRAFFSPSYVGREKGQTPIARFDLILLGMGNDGHTASLFPGTAAVDERVRWAMAHYVDKLGAWRITLTPALINAAANVIFIVSGSGKAEPLRQVLMGPYQPHILPAQTIKPDPGRLRWLVDAEAGALLGRG